MNAAHPMDEQNDLGCYLVDIGDHLMDKCADDTLLQPRIGGGSGPDALEVGCERRKRCRIDCRYGLFRVLGSDFVLPEGAIGCIARSFEIAHKPVAPLVPPLANLFFGSDGGRNGTGTNDRKKRILDGVIGPKSAKGDAARLAIVHPPTGAAVTRDVMLGA